MEAVLDRRRMDRRAAMRLFAAGVAALAAGCGRGGMIPPAGRPRAEALVAAYAHAIGAPDRPIGDDGDVTFGESGFFYDAAQDALFGRVYVNNALIEDAPAAELANYRRTAAALNDPAIGGMYDRAGGYFVLDEKRQAYFLVRRFAVAQTDPTLLVTAMERMKTVAAAWTARWLYEVAMIVHGHRPKPTRPVTLP